MCNFPFTEKMKKIQNAILKFVEDEDNHEENYENLLVLLKDEQIENDRTEFKIFLLLICDISNYHFRNSFFNSKIYRIIQNYFNEIQKYFTNDEIFHLFKSNKLLLLFLIENQILIINDQISSIIIKQKYFKSRKYPEYFYPEIKNVSDFKMEAIPENFEEKRKIGENDSEISELIRNDKIEDFIIYVNKNNYSLNSTIEPSIFETNPLLLKRRSNLIEYSAFFGSIQIFKYLYKNKVELTPSLWIYGIHGSDPEILHIFGDKHILPNNDIYSECILQSIKCFHNNTANYIKENYIDENKMDFSKLVKFKRSIYSTSFQYHNFAFFPDEINQNIFFFFACQFDYLNIVKYFVETRKINVNIKIVFFFF